MKTDRFCLGVYATIALACVSLTLFYGCRKPPQKQEPPQVETRHEQPKEPEQADEEKKAEESTPETQRNEAAEQTNEKDVKSDESSASKDSSRGGTESEPDARSGGNESDSDVKSDVAGGAQKGSGANVVSTLNRLYSIFDSSNESQSAGSGPDAKSKQTSQKKADDLIKTMEKELEAASKLASKGKYEEAFETADAVVQFIRQNEFDRFGYDGNGTGVETLKALRQRALDAAESYSKHIDVSVYSSDYLEVDY